ncbi:unnamed protein product [Paramecium sonneborni]|uniref:Myb-like domain-containing protein n=1 Tax=Paramecium sonneborni TaxID=65129 RepID=A0A8S1K0U5_9CILI|nr:unnamed protein product [Paramecium sonneborni]
MNMTVKLIRKSKKYNLCNKTDKDQSNNDQRRNQQQANCSHKPNSNCENQMNDVNSSLMSSQDHSSVGDITENLDGVYSHKLKIKNDQWLTKASKESRNKLIRYTVKREKDLKRKKQKNRAKEFSLEEDQRLLNYVLKRGPKFHKFSRYFPGKTTNMLKNRYYKSLRFIWDQVLGNEYQNLNEASEELIPQINQESYMPMFDELIQLKLFPEAEDLLSNFIGTLSQTFSEIQASFIEDYN